MSNHKLALGTLTTLVAISIFTPLASADYMEYDGMGYKRDVTIYHSSFYGGSVTTPAGEMLISYQGNDYISYCVDIYQGAGSGNVYEASVSYLDNGSRHDGDMVAYLYLTYGPSVRTGTSTEMKDKAAALQIAIWEVIFESDSKSYDLWHGNIDFSASSTVMNLAKSYLDSLPETFDGSSVTVLKSCCVQDMIISNVPEPATLVLLGIGGIALLRRRRA